MSPAKNIGGKLKRVCLITILGLIIYVLSCGPAACLLRHEFLPEKTFALIYCPLSPMEDWHPFQAYFRWWYHTKQEREWILAEETGTKESWLENAIVKLQAQHTLPPEIIRSSETNAWADKGYLVFSNGWASFTSHSSHDSEKIGDVSLLRTSDGDYYISDFHFCLGVCEFSIRPKDFSEFLALYGDKHHWIKKP